MALQFVTSQIKDSAITNDKLAGSIANGKLSNSTVAFGGVSLALGASDATPAFDLSDATSYPTSSLVGTITNAQLAGSIANAKLANSSVSLGGVSVALGGSDATPAFDLADATNYPTSSLVGTITNAQLAGSIANAKLANSAVTIAGNSVALGASLVASTLAGSLALDDIGVPDAAVAMNSQKITGLATPTADGDAATKAYVDSVAQGLDVKDSVKAATTANITLSGTQSIDGVSVLADDRVLVKDQSTGSQNGIYLCKAGAWARASDFAAGSDEAGAFTFVEQGTVNGESGFVCTNNKGGAEVGSDALSFAQFSGAGQITAGTGLSKSGNTISMANMAARTIKCRDANNTGAPGDLAIADGQFLMGDGSGLASVAMSGDATLSNTGAMTIANNAITAAKILNGAVDANKMAAGAIATGNIQDDAVTYAKMQNLATGNRLLGGTASGAISEVQVATAMVADSAVTLAKFGATPIFQKTTVSGGATNSINLSNRITVAGFRHGGNVAVFRNGQRLEYKSSGKSAIDEYDVADNGSTTSVGFGAPLENGDIIFITYMY